MATCQECCTQINLRIDELFAELKALERWMDLINKAVIAHENGFKTQLSFNVTVGKSIEANSKAIKQLLTAFEELNKK